MIHLNDAKYLCGRKDILDTPMQTYSDEVCEFLDDLSSAIMKSSEAKLYPDLFALAFWCRKANIKMLKEEYGDNKYNIGRGLCFHITPSNIPINFSFSYLFSLLAGNANIVRLPSKEFPQVDVLCSIFNKVLKKYPNIESRTSFIKYSKESNATKELSKIADAHMIWGGNNTINNLKSMETKPKCIDIAFSDRYSICIIDANKILSSNDDEMKKLANDFYTDTYLMDQNACSSPQLIYWINNSDKAKNKFWNYIYEFAKGKYDLQDAIVIDKYTQTFIDAIKLDNIDISNEDNTLYRIELHSLPNKPEKLRGKGGYFYEYNLKDFNELYHRITDKYQTVTYYGLNIDKFKQDIINNNIKGIDRVVPIGQSMNIGVHWD